MFVIFLISSISAVSAENMTDDAIMGVHDDSFYLSEVNAETQSDFSEDINNDLLSSQSDSESLNVPESGYPKLSEPCQPPPMVVEGNNFVVVNKYWEGNYSGNIEEIEIQLLKKLNPTYDPVPPVPSPCPPKWKASPDDLEPDSNGESYDSNLLSGSIGDIVILPDENGVLTAYTIVQTVKITKVNGWKYIFRNLTFDSASLISDKWNLGDTGEYVIREINIPVNVGVVSSTFVKYFTCPVDGGLKVFWNLTNRIIENKTNETTNNTNETNEVKNETNKTETFEDVPVYSNRSRGPEPSETPEKSQKESTEKNVNKNVDVSNATGNPLFILLIVLALLIAPVLRKK